MNRCKCGINEFITKPNSYDVYQIVDGKLEYKNAESVNDKLILYCRECGELYPYEKSNKNNAY